MSDVKYHLLNYLYKFVLVTILVAVIIIEVVRLYLGYLGNLTEKVPELAGFWLLTILLQLPLQGFLLFNTDLILVPIGKCKCVRLGESLKYSKTKFLEWKFIFSVKKFHDCPLLPGPSPLLCCCSITIIFEGQKPIICATTGCGAMQC